MPRLGEVDRPPATEPTGGRKQDACQAVLEIRPSLCFSLRRKARQVKGIAKNLRRFLPAKYTACARASGSFVREPLSGALCIL
jgi:hypothetical protein